jgi:hypothetical protein
MIKRKLTAMPRLHTSVPLAYSDVPGSEYFWQSLWSQVHNDQYWGQKLQSIGIYEEGVLQTSLRAPKHSVHLGVFVEPYLHYVLEGTKTIESRFSTRRFAPYRCVQAGDVLLLKKSAGPVVGLCTIAHAWFYHLDENSWDCIKTQFTTALRAEDPEFWVQRQGAEFATLMRVSHVHHITPIPFPKRDRRGWAVLVNGATSDDGCLEYPHSGLLADT